MSTKIGTTTLKSSSRIPLNKREYAKVRGVTKLVAPQCVACSTEGKKEFPCSLQKEMRDFASKTCEKAKRSNPCKLGRNRRQKEKSPNGQLLKYVHLSIPYTIPTPFQIVVSGASSVLLIKKVLTPKI